MHLEETIISVLSRSITLNLAGSLIKHNLMTSSQKDLAMSCIMGALHLENLSDKVSALPVDSKVWMLVKVPISEFKFNGDVICL